MFYTIKIAFILVHINSIQHFVSAFNSIKNKISAHKIKWAAIQLFAKWFLHHHNSDCIRMQLDDNNKIVHKLQDPLYFLNRNEETKHFQLYDNIVFLVVPITLLPGSRVTIKYQESGVQLFEG